MTTERPLAVLPGLEQATVLLDPDRRRLLEALRERPDSASGLARRLGDSRQRLNHHLRTLEEAGLLELEEERRRGNCLERVLRVKARRFVLNPAALGEVPADPAETGDRFSASYLIALAAGVVRDLAHLTEKAESEHKRLATASLDVEVHLAEPSRLGSFVDDLTAAVATVVAKHHAPTPGARPFRLVAGLYPGHSGDTLKKNRKGIDERKEVSGERQGT